MVKPALYDKKLLNCLCWYAAAPSFVIIFYALSLHIYLHLYLYMILWA